MTQKLKTIDDYVENIWRNLVGRSGVGNELEACDSDIQEEIKDFFKQAMESLVDSAPEHTVSKCVAVNLEGGKRHFHELALVDWKKQMKGEL